MSFKIYRPSTEAMRVRFADKLKMELSYYRYRGYKKLKLENLVKSIQHRYIGATYGRTKEWVEDALNRLGVRYDERFVYLEG